VDLDAVRQSAGCVASSFVRLVEIIVLCSYLFCERPDDEISSELRLVMPSITGEVWS